MKIKKENGSHSLTDSPAGVRSGDQRCSYDGCEGNEFDSYKDHPLCEYHYKEHIYLQKVLMSFQTKVHPSHLL